MTLSAMMERRATPENPSFGLSDPAAWEKFLGADRVASGVRVNPEIAMGVPPFWQGVSMISGDIARMDLLVYKSGEKFNDRTEDFNHPAHLVCLRQWNDEVSAFQGWRQLIVHALIWGNGYAYIQRNGRGDVEALLTLLPDRTEAVRENGVLFYETEVGSDTDMPRVRRMDKQDVFHLRGVGLDGLHGMEMFRIARDSIGLAVASAGFASKFFKNGVRSGGILEVPAAMGQKAQTNLEEGFRKQYEGEENWFRTIVLRDGAKFHQLTVPPNEGQMAETRETQAREVANLLNIPPSRLGVKNTTSYNSQLDDNQRYLDSCLSPWLKAISSECWMKLLSLAQRKADSHFFAHITDELLKMNPIQRAQVHSMAIRGWMTADEIRRIENLPPTDWGSAPPTGGSAGGADKGGAAPARGPEDQSGGEAPAPNPESTNQRRIVFAVTQHARHKAKKPNGFIEWIDGNLMSHRNDAIATLGEDSLIDEMVRELRAVAETASSAVLESSVENWAQQWEAKA